MPSLPSILSESGFHSGPFEYNSITIYISAHKHLSIQLYVRILYGKSELIITSQLDVTSSADPKPK